MKEFYQKVLISMVDVAKTGARVSARQHFEGTLSAIARDLRNRLEFLAVCTSYPGQPHANLDCLYEAPLAKSKSLVWEPLANHTFVYEAPLAKSESLACKSWLFG